MVSLTAALVSLAHAMQQVRQFLHSVEEGDDRDKALKRDFEYYFKEIEINIEIFSSVKDHFQGDGFEEVVEALSGRLQDMNKEANQKYRRSKADVLMYGVPLVFWKANGEFMRLFLERHGPNFAKYKQKQIELQRYERQKSTGCKFAQNYEALRSKGHAPLCSIDGLLNSKEDWEDIELLRNVLQTPDRYNEFADSLLICAMTAAMEPYDLVLVGSIVTHKGRQCQVKRVTKDSPHYCVIFDDDLSCDWIDKDSVQLHRWGPTAFEMTRAFFCVQEKDVPVQHRPALKQIHGNVRNFLKFYQHEKVLVDILHNFFDQEVVKMRRMQLNRDTNILVAGNPGGGKSCVMNGYYYTETGDENVCFVSGCSPGSGLTQYVQWKTVGERRLGDTPGLFDPEDREKCAAEIESALKEDGLYVIIFVLKLQALRVMDQDVMMMKTILDACPSITRYGILFTQVKLKQVKEIRDSADILDKIVSKFGVLRLPPFPQFIEFFEFDTDLHDENDVIKKLPHHVKALLDNPDLQIQIRAETVRTLDVRNWDDREKELKAQMKTEMDKTIERMQMEWTQKYAAAQGQYEEQIKKMKQSMMECEEQCSQFVMDSQARLHDAETSVKKLAQEIQETEARLTETTKKAQKKEALIADLENKQATLKNRMLEAEAKAERSAEAEEEMRVLSIDMQERSHQMEEEMQVLRQDLEALQAERERMEENLRREHQQRDAAEEEARRAHQQRGVAEDALKAERERTEANLRRERQQRDAAEEEVRRAHQQRDVAEEEACAAKKSAARAQNVLDGAQIGAACAGGLALAGAVFLASPITLPTAAAVAATGAAAGGAVGYMAS